MVPGNGQGTDSIRVNWKAFRGSSKGDVCNLKNLTVSGRL